MVLLFVASLALAGDPPPASSGDSGTAAPATPAPAAPAPAAPSPGTPPPPAPGAPPPPPPPVEAPPEFRPPAPVIVVVEPAAPVAPKPPEPGVGLRVTTGNPYKVKDAAGHRYTAVQLARLVGDTETLRKLADRREFSKIGQTTAAISGGGLLVASLVVVASLDGQPHQLDYSVDPSLYETEEQYQVATDFAQGQYDKAVTSWQSQRLGTALFLAGTGGFVLASSPFIGRDNDRREDRPDLVYSREQAKVVVDKYNAAHPPVGASTPDAAAPTAPAATPPTPPEDLDPDPSVTPDDPDGTAKPVDRSGPLDLDDDDPPPPKVRARVLIGAGMVGVTGSF